ncbi:MAG: DNA gyrase subunit A [Deltaproteobacteria bacterium]|jgi:DNA gyrase subunit A
MSENEDTTGVPPTPPPGSNGGGGGELLPVMLEDEMRNSYLDYAMSVIIGRALPDVRDGLKPVHRRVLYAMHEAGNFHNRPHKKSARVVGNVIGKYHPHGDSAVYDSVVRLAQPFSMREPLVDGQGNFGSIDGDPPAAMRYTEVRLTKLASEMLADIDKDTVDFQENYDDSEQEPVVLPNKFPNLLVNGAQGIAVGMATNIPPHNLGEVIEATIAMIRNPEIDLEDLIRIVPGPDFPTGAVICGRDGIRRAYETGRGSLKVRGVAEIEERKKGGYQIVISELPYQVNKAKLCERIADLHGEKRVDGISDVRDESDRHGLRVVIELKRDAVPQVTLNQLYSHTALESTFAVNMLAISHGQPKVCGIADCLHEFVEHRREVVTRRTAYELAQAEKRFHTTVGLLIALDNIDRVIQIIRSSKDPAEAKVRLVAEPFKALGNLEKLIDAEDDQITHAIANKVVHLTEAQAQAILDLRLHRLTGLEADRLREEAAQLKETMARLKNILAHDDVLMDVIVGELEELKAQFANPRRTRITGEVGVYTDEDLIAEEDMVVTMSHRGYVKRTPTSEYRAQNRGGRGVAGTDTKAEDFVEALFSASTHAYLLVFTNQGRVYWIKVHELPLGGRTARGKPLVNLIAFNTDERVTTILPVREFTEDEFVFTVSREGTVKKTPLDAYSRPRAGGIIGAGIADGDEIIEARLATDENDVLIATAKGMAIRFKASDVRSMGRPSVGVRGIRLDKGDRVVGMAVLDPGASILTVTENGYGKRTLNEEYRVQGRGGRGIILIKVNDRNGNVIGVRQVTDENHIMIITNRGVIIRMHAAGISTLGRNTQGVRLVRTAKDDSVQAIANLEEVDDDTEVSAPVSAAEDDDGEDADGGDADGGDES